jgi:hypothetical protein
MPADFLKIKKIKKHNIVRDRGKKIPLFLKIKRHFRVIYFKR